MSETAFPVDWTAWRAEWDAWREQHRDEMGATSWNFGPKNMLADEVLGKWSINGRPVELSEVTMPDFSKGYGADRVRYVGITFGSGVPDAAIVASWGELDRALGFDQ